MTKRRRVIITGCVALAIMVIALFTFKFAFRAKGVGYHNACIERAKTSAIEIEIKDKTGLMSDRAPRIVKINNQKRMTWILGRLELPPAPHIGGFHKCAGHLAVTIRTKGEEFHLSYDHGNGIYPISRGQPPGFIDMDKQVCKELNEYFLSLGFTKEELGIH